MRQILFLLCVTLLGCQNQPTSKPQILVSLAPYQTLVQKIAGEDFTVATVVPLNADPHNYEPTARQLTELSQGKIWFRIGESFENKLLPFLTAKPVDMREGIHILDGHCCHHHHNQDRHIWLSPKLMVVQAEAIAKALSELYPEQAPGFQTRLIAVRTELETLDREIAERIHAVGDRSFLVSHPAFAYFCHEYNCHQLSVEHEGKEPRPKEIEALFSQATSEHVKLAVALPQHNNKGVQVLAGKLQIPVRVVDPYAPDYLITMRKMAELIANPYQNEYD
jgi:zinc transport system substrate-binding protein